MRRYALHKNGFIFNNLKLFQTNGSPHHLSRPYRRPHRRDARRVRGHDRDQQSRSVVHRRQERQEDPARQLRNFRCCLHVHAERGRRAQEGAEAKGDAGRTGRRRECG